LYIKYISS